MDDPKDDLHCPVLEERHSAYLGIVAVSEEHAAYGKNGPRYGGYGVLSNGEVTVSVYQQTECSRSKAGDDSHSGYTFGVRCQSKADRTENNGQKCKYIRLMFHDLSFFLFFYLKWGMYVIFFGTGGHAYLPLPNVSAA
jgi:hypothetical protein